MLTQHAQALSQSEIQEATKRLQRLKYYPREDMENQRILRFSERIVGEISPLQRESLEVAIDAFEAAMNSAQREEVEGAKMGLVQVLSLLGYSLPGPDSGHDG